MSQKEGRTFQATEIMLGLYAFVTKLALDPTTLWCSLVDIIEGWMLRLANHRLSIMEEVPKHQIAHWYNYLVFFFAKDAKVEDSHATVQQHANELLSTQHDLLAVSSNLRSCQVKDDNMTSYCMCRSFADAAPMMAARGRCQNISEQE